MSDFSGRHALVIGGSDSIEAATEKPFLVDGGSVNLTLGLGARAPTTQ